jgi:hypothetical protein
VTEAVQVSQVGSGEAVLGTAVIQGKATDILDLPTAAALAGVHFSQALDLGPSCLDEEEVAYASR